MSAATVTYHELPPMSSWAADAADPTSPFPHHGGEGREGVWHAPQAPFYTPASPSTPFQGMPQVGFPHPGSYHPQQHHHHPFHYDHKPFSGDAETGAVTPGAVGAEGWAPGPPGPAWSTDSDDAPTAAKKARGPPRLTGRPTPTAPAGMGVTEELCLVCGDKASGYHYNSLTCEGCKGFFRRSITRKAVYYCKYGGNCDIDMYMRRKCQCCRLRKCMEVGMRPELVIPEDQCRIKREAKAKMRGGGHTPKPPPSPRAPPDSSAPPSASPPDPVSSSDASLPPSEPRLQGNGQPAGLTPEQRELLSRLLISQHQYAAPTTEALSKLTAFNGGGGGANQPFQHLAELTILSVQLIVEFTKSLPGFLTLDPDDQLTLLKASSTEVLMLRTAKRYDLNKDHIVLGNSETSWAYNRAAYREAGIGAATEPIFDFAAALAKLGVDDAEYALLTAVAIFSDRNGLKKPKMVEDIQEIYTSTLQAYIDMKRPTQRSVFARLLMKLSDLRALGSEQAEMLLALTTQQTPGSGPGCLSSVSSAPELTPLVKLEPESGDWASDTASSVSSLHPFPTGTFPFPTTPSPTGPLPPLH